MSRSASPEAACQLDSRYWKITMSDGNVEEVQGPGVVGASPASRWTTNMEEQLRRAADRVFLCRRVSGDVAREGARVRQLHHLLHPVGVHGRSLHLPQAR